MNSLTAKSGQRTYDRAITDFVNRYCSEPRLAFNRTVVFRYRMHLEQKLYAPTVGRYAHWYAHSPHRWLATARAVRVHESGPTHWSIITYLNPWQPGHVHGKSLILHEFMATNR